MSALDEILPDNTLLYITREWEDGTTSTHAITCDLIKSAIRAEIAEQIKAAMKPKCSHAYTNKDDRYNRVCSVCGEPVAS